MKKQIQIAEIDNGYLVQHQVITPVKNEKGETVMQADMVVHHCNSHEEVGEYIIDTLYQYEQDKENAQKMVEEAVEKLPAEKEQQ